MATASRLDTLDYAKKLEAAGVPKAQAELQASALNDALASSVASSSDLSNLEQAIDGRFASLQAKIDARFQQVDARFDNVDARFDHVDLKLAHLESRVEARIGSVELKLGRKIETLQWMFGVIVAMNAAVLVQLFLK
jgi:tetrahydromethanopterin S-methyltransferase subunit G